MALHYFRSSISYVRDYFLKGWRATGCLMNSSNKPFLDQFSVFKSKWLVKQCSNFILCLKWVTLYIKTRKRYDHKNWEFLSFQMLNLLGKMATANLFRDCPCNWCLVINLPPWYWISGRGDHTYGILVESQK